ncbi:hypothetical protein GQ53DRAFT_709016, partial [Thozetella sp. PMI_491]
MGAYVSISDCRRQYNVTLDCSDPVTGSDGHFESMGGVAKGQFQPDPDVAGIGVLGAFVAVTSLSLFFSLISTIWWLSKHVFKIKARYSEEEKLKRRWQLSVTGLCETLVVTCSDQQVFTGLAYAITLRYSKGCQISAYHYNIVANMMLLTCATHLMAVTISRHYWEHILVALIRIVITAGVYLATGIMLSNQGSGANSFPTEIPQFNTTDSLMFMQAACFQTDASHLLAAVESSVSSFDAAKQALFGNQIHGWNQYLVMVLFYFLALLVGLGRFITYGAKKEGKRAGVGSWARRTCAPLFRQKWIGRLLYTIYLAGGIGISTWTVAESALYILNLRKWVNASGWLALNNGKNPEDDPTTFGQLVPLLLIALTVFSMMQVISERLTFRRMIKDEDKEAEKTAVEINIMKGDRLPDIYSGGPGMEGRGVHVTRIYTGETEYTERSQDSMGGYGRKSTSHSR